MRLQNHIVPPNVMWTIVGGAAFIAVIILGAIYWFDRHDRKDRRELKKAAFKSGQKHRDRKRSRK